MISILFVSYLALLAALSFNWLAVASKYNIKWNGYKWVVRDSRGRFVVITRNPWTVLSLLP